MISYDFYLASQRNIGVLGDSGFFRHQGIVKATVSRVFKDLKSKISV